MTQRDSVFRLVWRATTPQSLALVGLCLGLLIIQVWFLWRLPARSLWHIAFGFRLPVFLLGVSIINAGFMVHTPSVNDRKTDVEDPGAAAVAQPVIATIGMACVGFAIGLNVIVWFTPPSVVTVSSDLTFAMGLPMVFAVVIYLFSGYRATRRLYQWTEQVAASAATAEADADAAQIAALQSQMNPHFLFNALNTVASLLGTDSARGQRTVHNLKRIMKQTLERSSQPLTTVADEVQFVRDYLDIESERFGSRLQVTYTIEPDTMALSIPTMSLQPIVENAIKHAISSRLEGGHIRITVARRHTLASLRLSVEDDGPGFGSTTTEGTGLRNLRARLQTLYGSEAMLATDNLPQGARVSLTIPIRDAS